MKKLLILMILLSPLCLHGDEELDEILMKPHEEHYGVQKLPEIPPPVAVYKDA